MLIWHPCQTEYPICNAQTITIIWLFRLKGKLEKLKSNLKKLSRQNQKLGDCCDCDSSFYGHKQNIQNEAANRKQISNLSISKIHHSKIKAHLKSYT